MKRLILITVLICCCGPPVAADQERLIVGNVITLQRENVYHRDYFGCYDIENTKKACRRHSEAAFSASRAGFVNPDAFAAGAIDHFVHEHHLDYSTQPNDLSNKCSALTATSYEVVRTYDWTSNDSPQLVCLAPTVTFDISDPVSVPSEPSPCWWTNLNIPPPLTRR